MIVRKALFILAAAGAMLVAAACGQGAAPAATAVPKAPAPAPTAPPLPTAPPAPTVAPTKPAVPAAAPTAAAAKTATINVVAKEFEFQADALSVPTGSVHFSVKNTGKMNHDFFVLPWPQDLTPLLVPKRAKKDVDEAQVLKDANVVADDLEPGKTGEKDLNLKPGLYMLACFASGKNPDGSTYIHWDKGQQLTFEVTGPGFASLMGKPTNTMNVSAKEFDYTTDSLLVAAGDVTFNFKNNGKMNHDFMVLPSQDRSELIAKKVKGEHVDEGDFLKGGKMLFDDLEPGKSGSEAMKLTPGTWVAACFATAKNPDGSSFLHIDKGQMFTFTVK